MQYVESPLPIVLKCRMSVESILLTTTAISTFFTTSLLTKASGFFFENGGRLYLVTSRHVLIDEPNGHRPSRIEIEIHTDSNNAAQSIAYSIPLYQGERRLWRQGADAAGSIDVAVVEVEKDKLPKGAVYKAFTPEHIQAAVDSVEIGTPMLILGFPLGFHDTLHHLPVARQAINASTFSFRFQGNGYFLTDARTHRGSSGAAVIMRNPEKHDDLPWSLVGIHSARLDIGSRDQTIDEALGLNCAWFPDILLTLTKSQN